MKLFRKDGDLVEIVAYPGETVYKGDYLLILDESKSLGLVVQVIDFEYIEVPGLLEDVIREGLLRDSVYLRRNGHSDRVTKLINDIKILKCKIRSAIKDGKEATFLDDLPSRLSSKILRVSPHEVLKNMRGDVLYPIVIGSDMTGSKFSIDAYDLDGSLTLITGMKGSGKSHLSKLLAYNLVSLGARFIILDINSEYRGLGEISDVHILEPGRNIMFNIDYLGKETVINVLTHILGLPSVSVNLFGEIWSILKNRDGRVSLDRLEKFVDIYVKNLMVKDAIINRLNILRSCRFIRDDNKSFRFEDIFQSNGVGYVIDLKRLSPIERKIFVEILLSITSRLLEEGKLPPFFLFAEEAHLYIRETYWEDIVTRMRHFGLFLVFITNQPDSLGHMIFRQLDNIFVFRFLNDKDLETLSRISAVDGETIKSIVKDIGKGSCLVLGKVVCDMPVVVKVSNLSFKAMGETKRIFSAIRTE